MGTDRIADMTVDEFRSLIQETVWEVLLAFADEADPDEGKEFRPEVAERLRAFLKERPEGRPLEDIERQMGVETIGIGS